MRPNYLHIGQEVLEEIPFQELLRKTKKEKWNCPPSIVSIHGFGVHTITSNTRSGSKRYWFECPGCKKRCWILFYNKNLKQLGCRKCLGFKRQLNSQSSFWSKFFTYCRKSTSRP